MRDELQKILRYLPKHKIVYLQGPLGSGKTYLARNFISQYKNKLIEQNKPINLFALYINAVFENGKKSLKTIQVDSIYSKGGELKGWQSCQKSIDDLELTLEKNSCQSVEGWKKICSGLKRRNPEYNIFIILDDYGIWREGIDEQDFAFLLELQKSNVAFLLASRTKAKNLTLGEKEWDIFTDYKVVSTLLPSKDDTFDIVRTCWDEQHIGEKINLSIENCNTFNKITGNYPGMINALAANLEKSLQLQNLTDKADEVFQSEFTVLLNQAKEQNEFKTYVNKIWASIRDQEKYALSLLAISKKEGHKVKNLFDTWDRRALDKVYSWQDMQKSFEQLINDLLLCVKKDGEYFIPSQAIIDFTDQQPEARALRTLLDLPARKHPRHFNRKKFLWLWTFGTFLFLFGIYIQDWLSDKGVINLPNFVLLFSWAPAIWHFVHSKSKEIPN